MNKTASVDINILFLNKMWVALAELGGRLGKRVEEKVAPQSSVSSGRLPMSGDTLYHRSVIGSFLLRIDC